MRCDRSLAPAEPEAAKQEEQYQDDDEQLHG